MNPRQLVGAWRFARSIRDRHSGTDYAASGDAVFTALEDGRVRWEEHGVLEWDGGSTPVQRTLFLVPAASGSDWAVTFEDGREFHPWTGGAVTHLCGRDLYSGTVAEPGPAAGSWAITWDVTGPEKDYRMTSTYAQALASRIV